VSDAAMKEKNVLLLTIFG